MNEKERIVFLRKELSEHNHAYYVLDKPIISDFEFDKLLKELQEIQKKKEKSEETALEKMKKEIIG